MQLPRAHWSLLLHEVKQPLLPLSHMYGSQSVLPPSVQAPCPLQTSARRKLLPWQPACWQTVPAAWKRQPPAPSQRPSVPQLVGDVAWHMPDGSDAPAGTSLQKPTKPLTLQARQRPQLAMLQQTPLVQNPVPHWALLLQLAPWDFSRQVLLLQVAGETQSPSLRQVVGQVPPLVHWKLPQLRVLGVWQLPLPLQVAGGVATLPLHEPARQTVPAT
jgi:hypothetical protein